MNNVKLNKFNHVGRPTNEEIRLYNKNKKIKIIGFIACILIIVGGMFLYLNKENLDLAGIMGNSSVKTVTFEPDTIYSKNTNLYYYKNNTNFVSQLYEKAGFSKDYLHHNYKRLGIKVYNSKKKYLATFMDDKIFYVDKKYGGQTLILQVFMQHEKTGKKINKLVYLYINKKNMHDLAVKYMLNYSNSLVGKNFNETKKVFSSYESKYHNADWCSWFVWNIYFKYGFVKKNSWINSYGDINYDPDLRYALGWTAYKGYNGYIRGKIKNDINYKPKPGDLILYKWDDTGNSVDHIGIVKKVTSKYIETIEGNTNGNQNSENYYLTSKVSIKKRALVNSKYIGRTYDFDNSKKDKGEIIGYFYSGAYF